MKSGHEAERYGPLSCRTAGCFGVRLARCCAIGARRKSTQFCLTADEVIQEHDRPWSDEDNLLLEILRKKEAVVHGHPDDDENRGRELTGAGNTGNFTRARVM